MIFKQSKNTYIPSKILIEDFYQERVIATNRCKFLLAKAEEHSTPYVVLIIPPDSISPINYPLETWDMLHNLLSTYNLPIEVVDIYLDFQERFPNKGHFMQVTYELDKKGQFINDSYGGDLKDEDIPLPVKKIRDEYYNPINYRSK